MPLKRDYISEEDAERISQLQRLYGQPAILKRFSTWLTDPEKEEFFIKIAGNGYHDRENPGLFIYHTPKGDIRIEADYVVHGRSMEGCGIDWSVTKLVAPSALQGEADSLLRSIRLALIAYGVGFDPAVIDEVNIRVCCSPEFL